MKISITKAEDTEQLGTPTFGIVSAIAHMRRFMHSQTSYHAFMTIFFVNVPGLFFGVEGRIWRGGGGSKHHANECFVCSISIFSHLHNKTDQQFIRMSEGM